LSFSLGRATDVLHRFAPRKSLPETEIIDEVIPMIDATYRTHPVREQRAIAGMSMGGFGALEVRV